MSELSQSTQRLIQKYRDCPGSRKIPEGTTTIHVDEVASRVASFYEKIRGVIEWREEHLLRKSAVERMLRRRLLTKTKDETIGEPLLLELIRGGHFPNDAIPESKIEELQRSIDKYCFILENCCPASKDRKSEFFGWLLGIAACEVEYIIAPPLKEEAQVDYMVELMTERIKTKETRHVMGVMSEQEKNNQIYVACQRALFKFDNPLISYHLLAKKYPGWHELVPGDLHLSEITKEILTIEREIEFSLFHPWGDKFYQICERYDTPYLIVGDIVSQNPHEAQNKLRDPQKAENEIRKSYGERFARLKHRLARAAIFSTLSIFITKVLSTLIIEIPFDTYVTHSFSNQVLALNILIPPLLMFLLVVTIKPPRKGNLERVMMEVMKILYETEKKDVYEVQGPARKSKLYEGGITFLYLLGFVGSLSAIMLALYWLRFGMISVAIFFVFFSLISYAGVKIRQRAKELLVEEEKETFLSAIFDFFSLPIIRLGKWLSQQWEKYNALVLIFNSFVDMPFQAFVEFLEQWRYFLKEKKEEIH